MRIQLDNPIAEVITEMDAKGGEFVRRLASAMMAADSENMTCIVNAFPHIMERYDAFATIAKREIHDENDQPV